MQPDQVQPDYTWIQNMPYDDPSGSKGSRNRRKILFLVAIVVLAAIAVVVALLLTREDKVPQAGDVYTLNSQEAEPVRARAEAFRSLLVAKDYPAAQSALSPDAKLIEPLNEASVTNLLGEGLLLADCKGQHTEGLIVSREVHRGELYDMLNVDYECAYPDGWPVILSIEMGRKSEDLTEWMPLNFIIRDTGVSESVI